MTKILPLNIKLSQNPKNKPFFSKKVCLEGGEELSLADPRSTRAMVALMDMQAVLGGAASHWGGPASLAEIMSALYGLCFQKAKNKKKQWYELAHIINDEGHSENGIYALKANYEFAGLNINSLKGFRSLNNRLTGHGEVHLFPEGVYLSNGPLGSSLPQAQGLAMADYLSKSDRLTVAVISDGACMEGEAKESLAAIPGFSKRKMLNPFILVVNDNGTKLSGRIEDQSFCMQPSFKSLQDLGWKILDLSEGNNLTACFRIFEQAFDQVTKDPTTPILIHAKTIKGFGVQKTMDMDSGGHGFPLKTPKDLAEFLQEIYGDETVPEEFNSWTQELIDQEEKKLSKQKSVSKKSNFEKVQVGVSKALVKCKKEDFPLVSISSDLSGSTGVQRFRDEFPEASFDVGIAESNMISVASGFSKQGFIPVVDTFAQFGVTKGALPLIMASLSQAPVIAVFSHAGFQDAADGASHQALSYFAMTSSIPNTDVYCLSTSYEAETLITKVIYNFSKSKLDNKIPRTSIFFLGREAFLPFVKEGLNYELKKAQVVSDNSNDHEKSVTVVTCGPLLHQAIKAAEEIKDRGVIVINMPCINFPDIETISRALKKSEGRLITVEDHQIFGGMGSLLTHHLCEKNVNIKLKSLGVRGEFGQSAYKADDLYCKHKIDASAIAQAINSF